VRASSDLPLRNKDGSVSVSVRDMYALDEMDDGRSRGEEYQDRKVDKAFKSSGGIEASTTVSVTRGPRTPSYDGRL